MTGRARAAGVSRALAGLAIALAAGTACAWLHTPIPWMLGPLFALAFLRVAGVDVVAPSWCALRRAVDHRHRRSASTSRRPSCASVGAVWYLPVAAGAVFAIALGYVVGRRCSRGSRDIDLTTGVFASVPGGAAEMATLGERFGARVDRVAAAQSLRILIVVAIVPAAITALGVHGTDAYAQGTTTFDPAGFALLMAATLAGALVAQRFDVPNAFVLGSLAVAIPLTARGSSTCRRCRPSCPMRAAAARLRARLALRAATSCAARHGSSAPWRLTVAAVDRAVDGVRRACSRGCRGAM